MSGSEIRLFARMYEIDDLFEIVNFIHVFRRMVLNDRHRRTLKTTAARVTRPLTAVAGKLHMKAI